MKFPDPGPRATGALAHGGRTEGEVLRHLERLQHQLERLMRENQACLDAMKEGRAEE